MSHQAPLFLGPFVPVYFLAISILRRRSLVSSDQKIFFCFLEKRKWMRMFPSKAIMLVQRCKVSLVLLPPSNLFPPSTWRRTLWKLKHFPSTQNSHFSPSHPNPPKSFFTFAGRKKIHSFTHSWISTHTNSRCGPEQNFLRSPFHSQKLPSKSYESISENGIFKPSEMLSLFGKLSLRNWTNRGMSGISN